MRWLLKKNLDKDIVPDPDLTLMKMRNETSGKGSMKENCWKAWNTEKQILHHIYG